jgi:hypothetical protein
MVQETSGEQPWTVTINSRPRALCNARTDLICNEQTGLAQLHAFLYDLTLQEDTPVHQSITRLQRAIALPGDLLISVTFSCHNSAERNIAIFSQYTTRNRGVQYFNIVQM